MKKNFDFSLEDLTEDDDRQQWHGWDPDPLKRLRRQREHWLGWLRRERPYEFNKLSELVEAGCDRDRLVFYFYPLKSYKSAALISKVEFRRITSGLEQAIADIFTLRDSIFGLAEADVGPWNTVIADLYNNI